ncbi:MAG TPA: UDP-N-acetylmuramoyl-L-alanyl-D-glutamate--2,6-diaminopimelate ligase [Tepidisphaeraceae bacterium]|jgi:UDP-N-acetylmuramoyl-L-alanyl-D-glutamate--2,6-diaminopimelate ligase|nr:UDP-N-acetylmuramoyl-L-alanyl-D-glutamate--2,6-diaminopimelate ligase [Tepidisphaeraceae bacterium]
MQLRRLLAALSVPLNFETFPDVPITGICEDSRRVEPGNLFVARIGTSANGSAFLADAAARGAVMAIVQRPAPPAAIPTLEVDDAGAAVSILANAFHGQPSKTVRTLAVTGTNGKTTTAYLVRELIASMGEKCGVIGTVEIDDGRSRREADMTTPSATTVAELLAAMRDNGCRACAMEASSHALDQGRVSGVRFAGAAFTNLTGDHLDYHKDMEKYAAAKARLFAELAPDAVAVVNGDDPAWARMVRDCRAKVMKFGFAAEADYGAGDVRTSADGSRFMLHTPAGSAEVITPLIGKHNIANALAAAALVQGTLGLSAERIAAGLSRSRGAPGRLQPVSAGQPFTVLVDYAHTDDALENVLSAVRRITRGKLRVLFGCGGDRDRTKRPRMAKAAERLADVVYVTSDNPRREEPGKIIEEILTGLSPAGRSRVAVEPDRRAAIRKIVADAEPGDVVVLAGKGHENYQIVGSEKRHFDDVEEATAAIRSHSQVM